ncbi:MAG: hypothetical protein FJ125_14160, partial [Deltaproteobacteria bacterium]|nr:hypothetical protein [Deltaproteobacteria bacterium]
KPDNIFLVPQQGNPDFVKVLDFGIAKVPAAEGESLATAVGTVVGTPAYMSPEQAMGKELTPRSDLYSLGIILYELLAGVRPFQDTTPMGLMLRHLQEKPKPLREAAGVEVPQAVEGFLFRALAKAPDDRLPSAADFKRELRTAVFGAAWDSSPVPLLHMDTYGLPVVSRTPSGSVPALGDAAAGADLSVPAAAASRPTPPEKEPAEPARPTPGPRPLEVDLDAQAIGTAETMACEAVEEQVESPLPSVPAEAGNQVAADSRAAAQSLPPAPALAPASFSLLHCLLPHWMCRSGSRSGAPACPCCSLPCSPCSLPWVRPVHG